MFFPNAFLFLLFLLLSCLLVFGSPLFANLFAFRRSGGVFLWVQVSVCCSLSHLPIFHSDSFLYSCTAQRARFCTFWTGSMLVLPARVPPPTQPQTRTPNHILGRPGCTSGTGINCATLISAFDYVAVILACAPITISLFTRRVLLFRFVRLIFLVVAICRSHFSVATVFVASIRSRLL